MQKGGNEELQKQKEVQKEAEHNRKAGIIAERAWEAGDREAGLVEKESTENKEEDTE